MTNPPALTLPTHVGAWSWKSPDGPTEHFSYEILLSSYKQRQHSALAFARSKARANGSPLREMRHNIDVVANQMLLPCEAPQVFMDPAVLWGLVDANDPKPEQHLMVIQTIWFPACTRYHVALRQVTTFAFAQLVDRYGVAVQLIGHAPAKIRHKADFHVHLLCTAQSITSLGLGAFVRELLDPGCQLRCKAEWDAWASAQPLP